MFCDKEKKCNGKWISLVALLAVIGTLAVYMIAPRWGAELLAEKEANFWVGFEEIAPFFDAKIDGEIDFLPHKDKYVLIMDELSFATKLGRFDFENVRVFYRPSEEFSGLFEMEFYVNPEIRLLDDDGEEIAVIKFGNQDFSGLYNPDGVISRLTGRLERVEIMREGEEDILLPIIDIDIAVPEIDEYTALGLNEALRGFVAIPRYEFDDSEYMPLLWEEAGERAENDGELPLQIRELHPSDEFFLYDIADYWVE